MDDLHSYVVSNDLYIKGIIETRLNDGISDNEISHPLFICYRKDRCSVKPVMLLLYDHHSLSSYIAQNFSRKRNRCGVIFMWPLQVGCCYRTHQATDNEIDNLYSAIRLASAQQDLIMVNLNFPHINLCCFESSDKTSEQFLHLNGFRAQYVFEPTHVNSV